MSDNKYQVPALMRAKRILDLLCDQEADMPEIIRRLELPKSTVYNLLRTLEDMRFIRRLPGSQRYALGFRLYELGTLAVSRMSIRDQALPFLQELVRDEKVTCHLGALDGNEAVYLLKVDPKDSILINSWEGKRLTLNRSAMGKILLAWLPQEQQKELVDSLEFIPTTINAITNTDDFRNHLADVKRRQWAMDDEEDILGIRCLAAPVYMPDGAVRYALSVSGMVQTITEERVPRLRKRVMETAKRISQALGASHSHWTRTDNN